MLRAYILAYDISDPKRLRAMHKLAKAFGKPLQYSVYTCLLNRSDRVRLASRIEELIVSARDRVVILDIGTVPDPESWLPPVEVFGRQEVGTRPGAVIV